MERLLAAGESLISDSNPPLRRSRCLLPSSSRQCHLPILFHVAAKNASIPRYLLLLLVAPLACAVLLSPNGPSISIRSRLHAQSTTKTQNLQDHLSLNLNGLALLNPSSINGENDCFGAASDPRPIPAQINDCLYAALQILEKGSLTRPTIFARRRTGGFFQLPQTFHSRTCVVSVDVLQDSQIPALDCTQGGFGPVHNLCRGGFSHVVG